MNFRMEVKVTFDTRLSDVEKDEILDAVSRMTIIGVRSPRWGAEPAGIDYSELTVDIPTNKHEVVSDVTNWIREVIQKATARRELIGV